MNKKFKILIICVVAGSTILEAAEERWASREELLYGFGNINIQDKFGMTSLMKAVINKRLNVVKELLENGANVDIQDASGITALMYAASYTKDLDILEELLENGANVDIQDASGMTPLMHAIKGRFFKGIPLLIDKKPNPHLRNTLGQTAWEIVDQVATFPVEVCEVLYNLTNGRRLILKKKG